MHSIWDCILHCILSTCTPHRESGAVQSSSVACPAAHPHRQPPAGPGQTLHPAGGLWPGETQSYEVCEQCIQCSCVKYKHRCGFGSRLQFSSVCKWNGTWLSIECKCSRLVYLQILSELNQCRLPWIQEPLSAEDQQGRQSKGREGRGERILSFNMMVGTWGERRNS